MNPRPDGSGNGRLRTSPEDFADCTGFDPGFLGYEVPLPGFSDGVVEDVLDVGGVPGSVSPWLHYMHFSLAMSVARRFARVTAVNIDADPAMKPTEKVTRPPRWWDDPRVPGAQIGSADEDGYYGDEPYNFDRGHLVRREDPIWGRTLEEAKLANLDTHHFTNCTPQHEDFNQDSQSWRAVEEYILRQVTSEHSKISVFTGPVLRADDPAPNGIAVPLDFWKIVVTGEGSPTVAAFQFSQRAFINPNWSLVGVDWFERIRLQQKRISDIEEETGLDFGKLRDADSLVRRRGVLEVGPVEIRSLEDIVL